LNRSSARCANTTNINKGSSETTSAAAAVGHSSSRSKVKKSLIATGMVLTRLNVSTSGIKNKFQLSTKMIHAVAIIAGAMIGSTICDKICTVVAPSRYAASSTSRASCAR